MRSTDSCRRNGKLRLARALVGALGQPNKTQERTIHLGPVSGLLFCVGVDTSTSAFYRDIHSISIHGSDLHCTSSPSGGQWMNDCIIQCSGYDDIDSQFFAGRSTWRISITIVWRCSYGAVHWHEISERKIRQQHAIVRLPSRVTKLSRVWKFANVGGVHRMENANRWHESLNILMILSPKYDDGSYNAATVCHYFFYAELLSAEMSHEWSHEMVVFSTVSDWILEII